MAFIVKEIKLETSKQNYIQAIVAKQNDSNSRFLKVTFLDDGIPIPLATSSKVTINAERKDGTSDSFFGEVNDDNTATVPLHSWMLEIDGLVNCDVSIIDVEGRKLTTTTFVVMVEKAACSSEDITIDPQYNVLVNLIEEVTELKESIPESLETVSQGRHSKYHITSPGWKRIQNIIRGTHGTLEIGIATGFPYRMVQVLGLDLSGFVKYPLDTNSKAKPILTKRYENIFGEDEAVANHPVKITKVRIGYPKKGTSFPKTDGATNYSENPVNCYLDVYFDYEPQVYAINEYLVLNPETVNIREGTYSVDRVYIETIGDDSHLYIRLNGSIVYTYSVPDHIPNEEDVMIYKVVGGEHRLYFTSPQTVAFDMNFAGYSDSHNCTPIKEETNAIDTGIYGETLEYYSVDVATMQTYLNTANIGSTNYGIQMHSSGVLSVVPASEGAIDGRANAYLVITPKNLKYAVDSVLKEHGLIE